MVRFNYLVGRDEVLYLGPYILRNKLLIIKSWEPNFNFDEVLQVVPLCQIVAVLVPQFMHMIVQQGLREYPMLKF